VNRAPLSFVISGPPVGKGRPRLGKGGHVHTPQQTAIYEKTVKVYALRAMALARWQRVDSGRIAVLLRVYWPDARRRDLDNVAKCATDAMNLVVFKDDSQITEIHAFGELDRDNPRLEVEVTQLDDADAA
jgi:Holliday junction resolvase RusA-like endonuclease